MASSEILVTTPSVVNPNGRTCSGGRPCLPGRVVFGMTQEVEIATAGKLPGNGGETTQDPGGQDTRRRQCPVWLPIE